ncbi:MAG: PspC domain-containing protein [Bacteroidota bacterium]|jgi:phage shock protein C|nr:PspC domain-containing protein [Bacteroidota bacterium]MDP3913328.1 PspC domain-containing protein [Bacteroidota bacterium]
MAPQKRLTRSKDKMVGGVLAGIGNYFDLDPTIVRIGYVVLSIASVGFPGLIAYLIMWAIIPEESTF